MPNPYHDPDNGQFTTASGGSSAKEDAAGALRKYRAQQKRPKQTEQQDSTDYRGVHKAPGPGTIPAWDMDKGVPSDWYTNPEFYTAGEVSDAERALVREFYNEIRGKPNAMVTVYRSLPKGHTEINSGDWVTPSRAYAKLHGMDSTDAAKDWPVISKRVPASSLWQDGNSYYELGYHA